jgi:photosynthetic reaction center cytochrome c subunit
VISRLLARFSAALYSGALVVCCIASASAQQTPPAGGPPQGRGGGPGGPGGQPLQNIKVLKNLNREQVQLAMQYVAASLGVECNFCHVQGPGAGFDKDDKETKLTARKMMQMVMAINETQFEGRQVVSCNSCHKGRSARPDRTPMLALEMTPEEAAADRARQAQRGRRGPGGAPQAQPGPGGAGAPQGPPVGASPPQGQRGATPAAPAEPPRPAETLDQVLDKYIQALGGRGPVEKATTRVMTGSVTMRNLQTSPVTIQEKATGEYRIDIASQPNPTMRAFDGTTAWTIGGPQNQVRDLNGVQRQQGLRLADFGLPLHLKERYTNLSVSRYGKTDDKDTIIVTGTTYPDVVEQLHFDKASGLLLRRNVATSTALGPLPEQVDYSDYRDVAGIKVPFTVRYSTWNSLMVEKIVDVKINAQIAADRFAKPVVR